MACVPTEVKSRIAGGGIRAAVNHGVGDLYAGWEAIDDDAASLLLQNLNQFPMEGNVVFVAKYGCGQVAIEGARGADVVGGGFAVDQKRVGPKDLFRQLRLAKELVETHLEHLRVCRVGCGGVGRIGGRGGHGNLCGAGGGGVGVSFRDARR